MLRGRGGALLCLAVFVKNWTNLNSCSVLSCPDFPARPIPVIPSQDLLLVCVQGYLGLEAISGSISKAKLIAAVTDGL